jgi:hypothetical protein
MAKPKKSKLEERLEREDAEAKRQATRYAEHQRLEKAREEGLLAEKHATELTELLSEFRKECPIRIGKRAYESKTNAKFTFKEAEFYVQYGTWTIGGNSSDVDDYVTNHEGWCLYNTQGYRITDIFEVEKYSDPPKLKPTPKQFAKALIELLRHIDRDPRYFGLA